MKIYLKFFFACILSTVLSTDLFAQDTLSQIRPTDTTFIQKALRRYNRMNYIFYGRFTQGVHSKSDTNYIKSYSERIVFAVGLTYPYLSYSISPVNKPAITTNYVANISNLFGLRCTYKNISISYNFKLKSNLSNENDFAKTGYRSFNLKLQSNKLNHSISLSHLKGLTDIGVIQNESGTSSNIKREDITIDNFSYELVWNLSWKKYSFVAPRTYGQRQLKSKLGFMIKTGIALNSFKGDSNLISSFKRMDYENFNDISEISALVLQLAPGLGGNLVIFKRFYISSALFIGADYYDYNYKRYLNSRIYHSSSLQLFFDGEASIGYQTERLFAGFHLEWKSINAKVNDARIFWYNAYIGIHVGYRLNTPKIISKGYKILFPY